MVRWRRWLAGWLADWPVLSPHEHRALEREALIFTPQGTKSPGKEEQERRKDPKWKKMEEIDRKWERRKMGEFHKDWRRG
jgi:hypothetical protein